MYPLLEKVKEVRETGDYDRIPVWEEMFMDMLTPIQAVRMQSIPMYVRMMSPFLI